MRSVVTPYIMPGSSSKTVNIGDGFILRGIERMLGKFPDHLSFSSRVLPSPAQMAAMETCSEVILAGANQLTDDYTVWPGFDADRLAKSRLRLVPMGIGIHGEAERNAAMSEETRAIITRIHERLLYSSWRCPRTVDYLERSIPALKGRFLMTGCAVLYDTPLLKGSRFREDEDVVAVTPTERGDFWEREAATIDFVARRFQRARKLLVIHQDYRRARKRKNLMQRVGALFSPDKVLALRSFAKARGFALVVPGSADEALALYDTVDLHIGSRLHAHLHMLSQNRRSFLTKVDERVTGIAEHFGFPICDPRRLHDTMDFNFEPVREKARQTHEVMQTFVSSLSEAA